MLPKQIQSPSNEEDIPLIERPIRSHRQVVVNQVIRRKPLPANTSLPHNISILLQDKTTEYSQVEQEDLDGIYAKSTPVTTCPAVPSLTETSQGTGSRSWSPHGLRLPFLLALLFSNVVLSAIVIVLHWRSATHLGLGNDDGSSLVFFAWRFAPTLLAVLYVFAWMMLVNDISRTEPFARLVSSRGSSGLSTLLRIPGPWWSTLADSFPRQKNDHRFSLVMFCSVVAYVMGFTVLSPLSAALLAPRNVTQTTKTDFYRPRFGVDYSLQPALDTYTHFQTIGNVLQNVTTSAWITDQYTIVPFWPLSQANRSTGARLANKRQVWKTFGPVLQAELRCENMEVDGPRTFDFTYVWFSGNLSGMTTEPVQTLQFSSSSGCKYGFAFTNYSFNNGGSFWSGMSTINIPDLLYLGIQESDALKIITHSDYSVLLNHTEACGPSQIIFTTAEVQAETWPMVAKLCAPKYFLGNTAITVSISEDVTQVRIDEERYTRDKRVLEDNIINMTEFQRSFLSEEWNAYLNSPFPNQPNFGGPASLLGSLHNFRVSEMIKDPDIGSQASRIQRRSFGEAIQASLKETTAGLVVSGEIHTYSRRVLVIQPVAYIIEAVLILHLLAITIIIIRGGQAARPLGLSHDPALTNTVISLIASQKDIQSELATLSGLTSTDMQARLKLMKFSVSDGRLNSSPKPEQRYHKTDQALPKPNSGPARDHVIPTVLATWLLTFLTLLLGVILLAIIVLYWYSLKHGLYQSVFVFETEIEIGKNVWGTLAPYSIIPTLTAVVISLWWGTIESFFRKVQPFIAMAKGATPANEGSGMSYQSTYLVWAASKALRRKHWLLALICIGALFTQILTVTMSALWQKQPSRLLTSIEVAQKLQLRRLPHVTLNADGWKYGYVRSVVGNVFSNLMTNWMYSAAIQLTLDGAEPAWSHQGWSFVPLDLTDVVKQIESKSPGNRALSSGGSTIDVTVQTAAIRGRLECQPWGEIHHSWWLLEHDISNTSKWNTSVDDSSYHRAYEIGCADQNNDVLPIEARNKISLDANSSETGYACQAATFSTEFVPRTRSVACCAQDTLSSQGNTSLGYWTEYSKSGTENEWPVGFTVKWMHGTSMRGWRVDRKYDQGPYLLWPEKPRFAAANCKPVIERANADVTVDIRTGRVRRYHILDEPITETTAWADVFERHEVNKTQGVPSYTFNITTSYGVIFLRALLDAAHVTELGDCWGPCWDLAGDHSFNFQRAGLNIDFMTYSMLSLVENDTTALLNPDVLISTAQTTFTTFFQHFASGNLTTDGDGGWVFQRINATLRADLGDPLWVPKHTDTLIVNATALVHVASPVDILHMSPLAVWLCVCILLCLLVTSILIIILKGRYFSPLLKEVDSLADVAILVANSERFLSLVEGQGEDVLHDNRNLETKLGWFQTSGGDVKWGIELAHSGTKFLSDNEVKAMAVKNEQECYKD